MKKLFLALIILLMFLFACDKSIDIRDAVFASLPADIAENVVVEPPPTPPAPRTGAEILRRMEANRVSDGSIVVMTMTIQGRRGDRTISAKTWSRNITDSFTEYLAPARERGTKMLKLGDQLWTYSPDTDRTILISGHMLRQSVMGSDMSYEDMMEDPVLVNDYNAKIDGEETLNGRPVWILELTAKKEGMAYAKRRLWVDKERYIGLKEEMFASSGTLLKRLEVHEVMQVDNRWIAKSMTYRDMLRDGNGTKVAIDSIEFSNNLPAHLFTKAALRR